LESFLWHNFDESSIDMTFYEEICLKILSEESVNKNDIHRWKMKLCKKYHFKDIPSNSDIIANIPSSYSENKKVQLIQALQRKPMRTISGVAIVAVMTSPESCPHGKCIPCPGGQLYDSPQSYTGFEPAAMRGKMHDFDPFNQVKARLYQLKCIGHPTDKVDLIVMGGTFTARNPWYQEWYMKRCYDAMNDSNSDSLFNAMKENETAKHRCIGLTIETRPDWFRLRQVDQTLDFGATRVELGIQTIYDDVLHIIKRGHTVNDSIDATRIAKNAGFKVCYHLMPGLPGSDEKRDKKLFETIFSHSDFKPDMLKIYPCLVIKGTPLYDLWKKKQFSPLNSSNATKLIADIIPLIPEWVRIQRIQRDVPAQLIDSGVKKSNLRQLVDDTLEEKGIESKELRGREIGHLSLKHQTQIDTKNPVLRKTIYQANDGTEIFLSLVIKKYDAVIAYLRLREIHSSHRPELYDKRVMMIRELKVVGKEIEIGTKSKKGIQHKGFGSRLLNEAIRISCEDFDCKELFVLSGVGVKEYYRKYHNFKDHGIYLSKKL